MVSGSSIGEGPIGALDLPPEAGEFVQRAGSWIASEVSAPYLAGLSERSSGEFFGVEPEFSRRLGERGLIAITTPREHGGLGRTHLQQALLQSELAWHRAPVLGHFIAEREVIPALVRFGTDEQRGRWLPDLLAGRALCSQAFTEPATGSDLASVHTTATPTGGGWVLSGEKWLNSVAHVAAHLWVLARTGGPRHHGLGMFLIPARAPGITIEPLVEMTGVHRLNRIVFDEVEVDSICLVGQAGEGWRIAMDTVARERPGAARPAAARRLLGELRGMVAPGAGAPVGDEPEFATRLAQLEERLIGCELLWLRYARDLDEGRADPDVAGVTLKVYADRTEHELADLGVSAVGVQGALDAAPDAPLGGRLARAHLASPGLPLGGGAVDVLLTVLATRGLGLPRADAH